MEDKYFNEFFDKLYNGKLNIYEDEEEETSKEDVDKIENESDDDNEQNSILDELKKIIETKTKSIESITKNVEFILNIDNYKSIGDSDNAKRFKERYLNGFWELYDMESNVRLEPTWRKYIRNKNPNYDEVFKKSLKEFIENKYTEFKEKLEVLYIQSKLLKQTTIDSINSGIEKIRSVEKYSDLNKVEIRQLNGFWELYEIPNNERDEPNWRTYIRQGKPKYVKGFKEYIKTYIEDIYSEFKQKLEVLYNQYICDYGDIIPENPNYEISELKGILSKICDYKFMETRIEAYIIEPILSGIKKIQKNYTDLDDNFKDRYLNGFWELYDMESNSNIEPTWRKYIREGDNYVEGFKEYLKKFIEDKDSGFEERLNELFDQKGEGYEKTFTKEYGEEKYFEKINISNESRIHNLDSKEINIIISSVINNYVNSQIKNNTQYLTTELTDGDIDCIEKKLVVPIYENIINYLGNDENKVVSYDLECVQPLINNGKTVIDKEEKIEVKDILKLDSYYSEYIASPVKKSDNIETPKGKEIYKVFVENLLEKIKKDSSETFDKIINDVYGNISGMIIADDIYVPKENITLYISSQGQGYGRITLRYNINPKGNLYKIERGSDELKIRELEEEEKNKLKPMNPVNPIYIQENVNESYDSYLDHLVENFFNTGKLFP